MVYLISEFEKENRSLPEVDPIELIKIRMADFGYKSADLASEYGDKGTVGKVLNYKQSAFTNDDQEIQQAAAHTGRCVD